jgi:HK97 family phage major capsid protein
MKIEDLIRDTERDMQSAREAAERILKEVELQGRSNLTEAEDATTEALFTRMENARHRLSSLRELKAEEDAQESRLNQVRTTGAGRSAFNGEFRPGQLYGAGGNYRDAEPVLWRNEDGSNAVVPRGQRFSDHPVVQRALQQTAERDRHVTGMHGNFGQFLRAMSTTSGSAIVPTVWSNDVIDLARNSTVVFQAGAQLVPMGAKTVQIGRLNQDPTASFRAEGNPVTASDPAFDFVQLVATSLNCLVVASVEFLQDAPNAGTLMTEAIGKRMALEIDKAALFGQMTTGNEGFSLASPYPKGVLKNLVDNASGQVLGAATNGTAQTAATPWNEVISTFYQVKTQNENPGAFVSNDKLVQQYGSMYDTTNQPLRHPAIVDTVPWLTTNAIPSFTSGTMTSRATDLFIGDWSQLLVGQRMELEIRSLTERYAENGQVAFLAYWRGDVQVARPKAFAVYRYLQGA